MIGTKEEIILVGGGGHCSSVIDVIEQQGIYRIAGIVDIKDKIGEKNMGYSIIGCDDDLFELSKHYHNYFITIGQLTDPQRRIEIYRLLKELSVQIPTIISPFAYVSEHSNIGNGTIIMHMAQVNANAIIGSNCIINSKALIEHDAIVEDNCHIATGAIVNGGVKVCNNSFVGSGVVTKQYVVIPESSYIKANELFKGI